MTKKVYAAIALVLFILCSILYVFAWTQAEIAEEYLTAGMEQADDVRMLEKKVEDLEAELNRCRQGQN